MSNWICKLRGHNYFIVDWDTRKNEPSDFCFRCGELRESYRRELIQLSAEVEQLRKQHLIQPVDKEEEDDEHER